MLALSCSNLLGASGKVQQRPVIPQKVAKQGALKGVQIQSGASREATVATFLLEIGTEDCQRLFVRLAIPSWSAGRERLAACASTLGSFHATGTRGRLAISVAGAGGAPERSRRGAQGTACCPGFHEGGGPPRAAIGFARRCGVRRKPSRCARRPRGTVSCLPRSLQLGPAPPSRCCRADPGLGERMQWAGGSCVGGTGEPASAAVRWAGGPAR